MSEWLPKAFCVVGGATAAVVEAVYAGVPIVLIGRELGFEMNPLGWWEKEIPMFQCCYDRQKIKERILYWINTSTEQRTEEMSKAKAVVSSCFGPWDETLLSSLFTKDTHGSKS